MAGTLSGLSLSQQMDLNGKPMPGCQLYIYLANTTTPVSIYKDYALTQLHPFPLLGDANGRLPMFWLNDGFFHARLLDANLVEQFDVPTMPAVGKSEPGTVVGGGTGDPTPIEALAQTGDVKWRPTSEDLTGWVKINGQTIGNASSGADKASDTLYHQLYVHIWNNFPQSMCPVTGGRGANAEADWAIVPG